LIPSAWVGTKREFLNVLFLAGGARWRLVTFDDPDFDPGFATELPREGRHVIRNSVFADNADTVTTSLVAANGQRMDEPVLALSDRTAPPRASPRP
jgi:hypothetical protein